MAGVLTSSFLSTEHSNQGNVSRKDSNKIRDGKDGKLITKTGKVRNFIKRNLQLPDCKESRVKEDNGIEGCGRKGIQRTEEKNHREGIYKDITILAI